MVEKRVTSSKQLKVTGYSDTQFLWDTSNMYPLTPCSLLIQVLIGLPLYYVCYSGNKGTDKKSASIVGTLPPTINSYSGSPIKT